MGPMSRSGYCLGCVVATSVSEWTIFHSLTLAATRGREAADWHLGYSGDLHAPTTPAIFSAIACSLGNCSGSFTTSPSAVCDQSSLPP